MPKNDSPVPDLLIERLALGELDPQRAADLRSRLEATGRLACLAEIERSNRAILAAHPPATVLAEVQRRLGEVRPSRARGPRGALASSGGRLALAAAAAAAILALVARPGPTPSERSRSSPPSEGQETIALKGLRPHLVIYRKTPAGPARLTEASRIHAGETLQVAYVAAGRRFGVVLSQDARGSVTFHLPTGGTQAAALKDGGETATSHAFELDDTPGFERFVFVTADEPFSTPEVLDALRSKDGSRLPPGATWTELALLKEGR
jgi:hypothetical protein